MSQRSLYQAFSSSGTLLYHHINNTYENVINLFRKSQYNIEEPMEPGCKEKITFFETAFKQILYQKYPQQMEEEGMMAKTCKDCMHYELNLQKLEHSIRQHIRTQQQLKLHNENTQLKMQELKKQLSQKQEQLQQKSTLNKWKEEKKKLEADKKQLQSKNQKLKQELQVIRKVNEVQLSRINQNLMSLHHKNYQNQKLSNTKENLFSSTSKSSFSIDKKLKDKIKLSTVGVNKKGISINSKLVNSKTEKLFESKMVTKK